MANQTLKWIVCLVILLLVGSLAQAAPKPMTDMQLDAVYAAGFDIRVDLDVDLAATNPDQVIVTGQGAAALQPWLDKGVAISRGALPTRGAGSFDPGGSYNLNDYKNLVVNNINITDHALENATSLLNVFALQGDVAIGVNLNVIVNPVNSKFDISQNNLNWVSLNLSDTIKTLSSSASD